MALCLHISAGSILLGGFGSLHGQRHHPAARKPPRPAPRTDLHLQLCSLPVIPAVLPLSAVLAAGRRAGRLGYAAPTAGRGRAAETQGRQAATEEGPQGLADDLMTLKCLIN